MGGRTGSGDSSMSTPAARVLTGARRDALTMLHSAPWRLPRERGGERVQNTQHSAWHTARTVRVSAVPAAVIVSPPWTALHWPPKNSARTRLTLLMTCFSLRVLSLWAVWQADQLLFTISSVCWCWVLASSPSSLHENNLNNQPAGFPGSWCLHLMFSSWFAILCATFSECESSEVAKTKPYIVYIKLAGNKNNSTSEMWCLGWDDHIKALRGRVGQDYCK